MEVVKKSVGGKYNFSKRMLKPFTIEKGGGGDLITFLLNFKKII